MVRLSEISTDAPEGWSKKETLGLRDQLTKRLGELQHALYAENKRAILVVFQKT